MSTSRLEAFSDAVIAIIITLMAIELHKPQGGDIMSLQSILPSVLAYSLSFIILGIYWNNHHHLLRAAKTMNSQIMWANLHLLFWLTLIPFFTSWVGEYYTAIFPAALYSAELLFCAIAYYILQLSIIKHQGNDSTVKHRLGKDIKGKISPVFYTISIFAAFINPWISYAICAFVALMWLIPDRRLQNI